MRELPFICNVMYNIYIHICIYIYILMYWCYCIYVFEIAYEPIPLLGTFVTSFRRLITHILCRNCTAANSLHSSAFIWSLNTQKGNLFIIHKEFMIGHIIGIHFVFLFFFLQNKLWNCKKKVLFSVHPLANYIDNNITL